MTFFPVGTAVPPVACLKSCKNLNPPLFIIPTAELVVFNKFILFDILALPVTLKSP
jgi:hypothetical protein